jgi:hypothetical protein
MRLLPHYNKLEVKDIGGMAVFVQHIEAWMVIEFS